MDEQSCPRCRTTKYRNPSLKMLVNVCGHSLCESCVDMLFIKGSGACPQCGIPLRRNNYRLQVFEDAGVEKEMDIRKKILRDFNKKEDDFCTLHEYNDYLEMIETIIFNLTNGVDVDSTRRMIEQYKKENKEFIKKNQSKLSRDDEYLEQLIDQQRMEAVTRKQVLAEEEQREKAMKKKNKDALIDDLMFSDRLAKDIVATHQQTASPMEEQARPSSSFSSIFSSGTMAGQQSVFDGRSLEENTAYEYSALILEPCGPKYPTMDDIMNKGFLHNVRTAMDWELGGGFESQLACQRALQDSLCGLFHFPPVSQTCSPTPPPFSQPLEDSSSPMCAS